MDSHLHKFSALDADCSRQGTDKIQSADLPGWTCLWPLGLILLAFIPRALMAWRISTVCDDAHYYMYVADALGKGEYAQAFSYLNLNIYPVILLILHRSGLEWIFAGQVWGVLISSLTILPMYGWIQRVFDKRIAITACLLYAIHPELIEVSIEPIRGPTFWFLMTMGLYLSYRAVTEVRLWLFIATGIATALAIHTRSEGWLLFTPIALWSCYRMMRFPNLRWKLSAGTVLCLAMTPLLLVLVNVTLLRSHTQWEWGRLAHFKTCLQWVGIGLDSEGVSLALRSSALRSSTAARHVQVAHSNSNRKQPGTAVTKNPTAEGPLQNYFKRFIRTLEPVTLILLCEGLLIYLHSLQRRDKFVLIFVATGFLLAIWIRLSQIGEINGRYFFPVYFLLVPFVAIGFLWSFQILVQFGRRLFSSAALQIVPAVGLSLILTCVYLTDALNADHKHREIEQSFGMWLKERYGPLNVAVANRGALRVGYYASGTQPILSDTLITSEGYPGQQRPQLVVLSTHDTSKNYQHRVRQKLDRWEWIQIPQHELPETAAGFLVLVNLQSPSRIASKPGSQPTDGKTQRR